MASKLPAVRGAAYVFRCVLFAQSDNQIKSNPTIASGDWMVSIDGGAFANLATLPDVDPDSSVQVKVSLSADEMNGDEIMVTAIDAAGAEWHSAAWVIHTAAQTLDTMDTNIDAALADTNELQTDWANGGRLDVILDARASQAAVDDLPTNSELTTALSDLPTNSELTTALADLPTNAELATALAAADDAVLAAIGGLNDLDAAEIRAALGLAAANLDTQLGTLSTFDYTTDDVTMAARTVEGALNEIEVLRLLLAALAGSTTGNETNTPAFRDQADSKDRIEATIDGNGNRTVTSIDAS